MTEQITTTEALDALPAGTVLVDPLTNAVLRVRADDHDRTDGVETLAGAFWALSHGLVVVWPRPDAPAPSTEDREALADHLVALGLAEERPGYGHATGAQVADAVLAWFAARQPAPVDAEAGEVIDDHDYLPVAGHPDDDECTHRADGTDLTYCGEPREAHRG